VLVGMFAPAWASQDGQPWSVSVLLIVGVQALCLRHEGRSWADDGRTPAVVTLAAVFGGYHLLSIGSSPAVKTGGSELLRTATGPLISAHYADSPAPFRIGYLVAMTVAPLVIATSEPRKWGIVPEAYFEDGGSGAPDKNLPDCDSTQIKKIGATYP